MTESPRHIGAESLGLAGIALGLLVAFLVEPSLSAGPGDRPLIIAAVTAVVAMLWLIAVRLLFTPQVARATVPKEREPR
ncbi:MAG: hypothetical protein J2P46_07605 [Zavarzinella sp.]|nr:hypothetical protein [Zavarzinella sp.]